MKNSLTSTKVILLSLFSLAALAAWIFVVEQSFSHKSEVTIIEREAKQKSEESSYLISIKSALREAKDDIDLIRARFIDKDAIPDYISLLEGKAAASDIQVDFGAIDVDDKSLSIRMSGSGTWGDVVDFISVVDSMPYVSRIDGLNLNKSNGQSTTTAAIWNFNLHLVQYLDIKEQPPQL
jgi:hypothetical protein